LSEETILKFKLATLASIAIGILSIGMTIMGIWLGSMSTTQGAHGEAIATLKAQDIQQKEALGYIIQKIDEIRDDQVRRKNTIEKDAARALEKVLKK
jgi:hypothetical protein